MKLTKRKKVIFGVFGLVTGLAAAAFALGPPPEGRASTSQAQVDATGAETIEPTDPVQNRVVTMSYWAPKGPDKSHLVVLSHGFAGDRTSLDYLAVDLAARGYAVVAPTHPDVAGLDAGQVELDPFVLRPRHISLAIDAAAKEKRGSGQFEKVSVVGHSLGGYSALRVAGAKPAVDALDSHCQAEPDDSLLCAERLRERALALTDLAAAAFDSRVQRIVLLAPAYGPLFSMSQLASVEMPVLVLGADNDPEIPASQIQELASSLPATPAAVTLTAGHFDFVRVCSAEELKDSPELCESDPGIDRAAVNAEVSKRVADFLAKS